MAAAANIYQTREAHRENRPSGQQLHLSSQEASKTRGASSRREWRGRFCNGEFGSDCGYGDWRPSLLGVWARGSARMAALRKGGRDRVCGQRERQLNLGLV